MLAIFHLSIVLKGSSVFGKSRGRGARLGGRHFTQGGGHMVVIEETFQWDFSSLEGALQLHFFFLYKHMEGLFGGIFVGGRPSNYIFLTNTFAIGGRRTRGTHDPVPPAYAPVEKHPKLDVSMHNSAFFIITIFNTDACRYMVWSSPLMLSSTKFVHPNG